MLNEELFDQKIERFLKKQMTPDEERSFKEELASDPEKLARAKAMALAIQQMKKAGKDNDQRIIATVNEMEDNKLDRVADGSVMADFDERVELFLKGLMSPEEEKAFFEDLKSFPELENRAKIMSLVIDRMREDGRAKDDAIIEKIKNTDQETLERLAKSIGGGTTAKVVMIRRILAVAASILLLVGLFEGYNMYDVSRTKGVYDSYAAYSSDFNNTLTSRSKGTPSDSVVVQELKSLFLLVQKGDSLEYVTEKLSLYSSGISSKKYPNYEEYAANIDWNLAMAHLRNGNRKEAIAVLQKLANEQKGTPIADKANELLKQLKKMGLLNW
jgi:hypothetical protein